ncbi:MAG: NADH-quinone oxidoreductase subunit NuoN [Rhodoferax sp.]
MIDKLSWIAVYPDLVLFGAACVIAIMDLWVKNDLRTPSYVLTMITLGTVAFLYGDFAASEATVYGFGNMVVSDPMGNWLKCFATLAVMVTLVYARPYAGARGMLRGGELFTLGMFALLGMSVMISGNNLLVVYLGLELLTLSSYALVGLRRDDANATEAAMKYFVLGAMASGFLLYGMSMLYGATGTLNITDIFNAIASAHIRPQVLVFGLVFIVAGLAFKLGAVPFHMWVPDVYQGAPTAITLFVGGAPKLAAFGMTMRLLVEGVRPLAVDWQNMLLILALGSLFVGNLAAIWQANVKRMLAFSTISQMGFMLLGVVSGVANNDAVSYATGAYSSAMFYVVTYVLTTLATFGVLLVLSRNGLEAETLADLAGLNQRSPYYAAIMGLCLLSLAGIPPLVGFYAKLAVLQSLLATGTDLNLMVTVFAVLMSLIGAFYYLRVIKVMYFDAPQKTVDPIVCPRDVQLTMGLNAALLLAIGLFPGGLLAVCWNAVRQMLGT